MSGAIISGPARSNCFCDYAGVEQFRTGDPVRRRLGQRTHVGVPLSLAAGAAEVHDRAGRKARRTERLMPWALLSPALVISIIFFGIPMLLMLRMSFNEHAPQRLYVPGFTVRHYVQLLTEERFVNAIWTTVKLSLMASLATLVIGYAFALLVWLKPTRWRLAFIGLALSPLLISEISIIFGWWMFFPRNGLLSYALTSTGLLSDKISLMYTEFAAFVGLVYVTLPFCFFILLSIFDGIDTPPDRGERRSRRSADSRPSARCCCRSRGAASW